MCCYKIVDLNVCGLLLASFLCYIPGILFLVLGSTCVANDRKKSFDSCEKIDQETIVILLIFGCLFCVVGSLVAVFALVVRLTNQEEEKRGMESL